MKVNYDAELGWVLEDISSSGTWVHPKQYAQIFTGAKENSPPVMMKKEEIVKAFCFTLQFNQLWFF